MFRVLKNAKNGDFNFLGSSLTDPQNDPLHFFSSIFCVVTLGSEKNIKSQGIRAFSALRTKNRTHF